MRREALEVYKLGRVPYARFLALQESMAQEAQAGRAGSRLLCIEHPPTFTLGRRMTTRSILTPIDQLRRLGAELHHTSRGGDATFHGPGQAVLYPILALRKLGFGPRTYVEGLEDTMVDICGRHGITDACGRVPYQSGCWVGSGASRKIGAVGVRISQGVTSHGLAFNVDPDLGFYEHIVPCGIVGKEVTSLAKETGRSDLDLDGVMQELVESFASKFRFTDLVYKSLEPSSVERLKLAQHVEQWW